jgi:monofunctional glycosyltransferase
VKLTGRHRSPDDRGRPSLRKKLALLLVWGLSLFGAGFFLYGSYHFPAVLRLRSRPPDTTAFIERYRSMSSSSPKPKVRWTWVPYRKMASELTWAVLAAEDGRFFRHRGFDLVELENAIAQGIRLKRWPRGASTLSQQVAKNLWLSPDRSLLRKMEEAILTFLLESALTKVRILEVYLNIAEFGRGIYGVEAASQFYFGKTAATLTLAESAQLGSSLSRPRTWNPRSRSRAYWRKVGLVQARATQSALRP